MTVHTVTEEQVRAARIEVKAREAAGLDVDPLLRKLAETKVVPRPRAVPEVPQQRREQTLSESRRGRRGDRGEP